MKSVLFAIAILIPATLSAASQDPNDSPLASVYSKKIAFQTFMENARIGTNASLTADSPYVNSSKCVDDIQKTFCVADDLWQIFAIDPKGMPPKNTFTPRPTYYPLGSSVRGTGKPNPPQSVGIAPEKRRKMPGKNGR